MAVPFSKPNEIQQRRRGRLLWLYLALVVIHLLSGIGAEQPIILSDELGYLGNARYIAGVSHLPDMSGSQFYHFGYSLFLLPAFWLFADPVSTYRAAIVINALLVSSLIVPLFFTLTSFFRVPDRSARWIAFACCLYPPLIFHSSFAWSESVYIPLYAAVLAIFGKLLASQRLRDAVLFGTVTGFLYTIHPRGLPVAAAAGFYLFLLACFKSIPIRHLLLSGSLMASVIGLTRVTIGHLKAIGWAEGSETLVSKLAGRVVSGSEIPALIERASGQLLYLTQASQGLFLLGLIAALGLIVRRTTTTSFRRTLCDPLTGVVSLALMTSFAVFSASCASKIYSLHGPNGLRGGDFIYGRYNEAFAVMLIAFALAAWYQDRHDSNRFVWHVVTVVVIMLILTTVVVVEVDDALVRHAAGSPGEQTDDRILPSDVRAPSVPGVYPLVVLFGSLNLTAMSLTVVVSLLLIAAALRASFRFGIALLAGVFSCVAVCNYFLYVVPAFERAAHRLRFVSQLDALGPIEALSYDIAYRQPSFRAGIQYLMPDTVFGRFDSRRRETPEASAVISGNGWRQAKNFGARFYVSAGSVDNALWVMPGDLQTRLVRAAAWEDILGSEPVAGVSTIGFGEPKEKAGKPGRWTGSAALLRVNVDPLNPPLMLGIEVGATRRDTATVQLRVNGVELWNDPIPRNGGAKTFSLERVPVAGEMTIALFSGAITPAETAGVMVDRPAPGLFVQRVRLDGRGSLAAAVTSSLTLGAKQVLGFPESGFYRLESYDGRPARWTNGAARLRILLNPKHLPSAVEVATVVPNRDGAQLRIVANGVDLWDQPIPSRDWSRSFDLAGVPLGEELVLEVISDTFRPSEVVEGSKDRRDLGIMVRGIRLSADDRPAAR